MPPTIESLGGEVWPEPTFQSHLVLAGHALRKKPIDSLTADELRIAFNEDIGADFLKERVVQVLDTDPVSGDLFDSDLIIAVARSRQFREDSAFQSRIVSLAERAVKRDLDSETRHEISQIKQS